MKDTLHDTNVARFAEEAATWDDKPQRSELAQKVARAIIRTVPLHAGMEVLEYGCGTGLVTLELAPHVGGIVGVDSSAAMLDVLRRKIGAQGLSNIETIQGDFSVDPLPDRRFDLLVSSMTLHHVSDIRDIIEKFSQLLRPKGYLALADLDQEDGSFHDDARGIAHHGIGRLQMLTLFHDLGLADGQALTAHTIVKKGKDYPVFLAVARQD